MDIGQWDTVCTISGNYVNLQLTNHLASILQNFSYQGSDPLSGATYTISGNFGAWQVVGGSDQLIQMSIPIATGTVAVSGGGSTDIGGMTVVVEISLQLLPSESAGGSVLTFDFNAAGTSQSTPVPGLVVPISFTDPKNTGQGPLVESAVVQVLVHNAANVTFIFASIGATSADAANSWLMPAASAYQYQQPIGSSTGYLGILSVTTAQNTGGWDTQIDPALTSESYAMAFAISTGLFLRNVVMPALPSSFPGTSASTFSYDAGTQTINNTTSFDTAGVKVGLITYTPTIESLTVQVNSSILQIKVSGTASLHLPNASISFSVTANNTVGFSDGQLVFNGDPSPTTSWSKNIPWYDYVLVGIAGPLAAAIFAAVIAVVSNDIGNDLTASQVGASLTRTPPLTVQWPGMNSWTVQNAGLSTALYLQGQPIAS